MYTQTESYLTPYFNVILLPVCIFFLFCAIVNGTWVTQSSGWSGPKGMLHNVANIVTPNLNSVAEVLLRYCHQLFVHQLLFL